MIIVTGGAGFIGSHIVAALGGKSPHEVVICDRLGSDDKWRNIAKCSFLDIIPPEQLPAFIDAQKSKIKAIVHMGGISSPAETNADLIFRHNFSLSLGLWRWCLSNQVQFIYASSMGTYGNGAEGFEDGFETENLAKLQPLSPVDWAKHQFDLRIAQEMLRGQSSPSQYVGLKFAHVYGPNESHKKQDQSLIAQIYSKMKEGLSDAQISDLEFNLPYPQSHDGQSVYDFVWVDDVAAVVFWLLEHDHSKVKGLFNVSSGQLVTRKTVINIMRSLLSKGSIPDVIEEFNIPERMQSLRAEGYNQSFLSVGEGVRSYVQNFLETDNIYPSL